MPSLVADIGGTNARLALADAGGVRLSTRRRYRNRDFDSFASLVQAFMAECGVRALGAVAVAVAGPVVSGRARLTNLDWEVTRDMLSALAPGGPVVLLNDMVALAYALGQLGDRGLSPICPETRPEYRNGQALILGLGTGLNASILRMTDAGMPVCFEAELGHAELPATIRDMALAALGPGAGRFQEVEDCLSGRGLSQIHALATGEPVLDAANIVERAAAGDEGAQRALDLFCGFAGAFCRAAVFAYLPLDGIYLAGSVARGVFGHCKAADFDAAFRVPTLFGARFAHIPVFLINDDAAALSGCVLALGRK